MVRPQAIDARNRPVQGFQAEQAVAQVGVVGAAAADIKCYDRRVVISIERIFAVLVLRQIRPAVVIRIAGCGL